MQAESTKPDLTRAKALIENQRMAAALKGPSKFLSLCVSEILRAHRLPGVVYGEPLHMSHSDRVQIAVEQFALRIKHRALKVTNDNIENEGEN